jgi:phosphatidylglycerol:prolipoprotein diacylglycerol transferase
MRPILFQIGSLKLHSYGLLLVIGFFAATWNACREAERRGYKADLILDMALPLLLISVVACRLLYVLLNLHQFHSFGEVFRVWDGGLSFHGAFIGGVGTLAYFSWKRKIPLATLCDLITPSVFLGYFFGRIGCLLNGCCYGYACNLPWAMRFPDEHHPGFLTPPSHPAQLYSALMAMGLFFVMQRAKLSPKFNQFRGQLTLLFLAFYAVERGVMEYFRTGVTAPAAFGIPWLTAAQAVSLVALAIIALLWIYLSQSAQIVHRKSSIVNSDVPSR